MKHMSICHSGRNQGGVWEARTQYQIMFHQENKADLLCYMRVGWTQHYCTVCFFIPVSAKYASTNSFNTIFYLERSLGLHPSTSNI